MSEESRGSRHEGEESARDESGVESTATSGVKNAPCEAFEAAGPVQDRADALVGRVISKRYRIVAPIAKGGMGTVFRGDHMHMRKRVAIKILHAETEGLPGLVAQFEREAIAGAHVSHPNVANATDFGELEDGSYFLILEYVRGVTLSQVLEEGPLPVSRAVSIAKQIAGALHAVHDMGIVHRDVKPSNIMILHGPGDVAKLIDFGFARVPVERISTDGVSGRPSLAKTISDPDTVFGTIGYLAPEAAAGMDAVDGRSDLYALGAIMYEMLTGKRPFEAAKNARLFQMHRLDPPPPFRERAPEVTVPAAIEAVVMRLLEKSPSARFQTGHELIEALDRAVAASTRPPPPMNAVADVEIPSEMERRSRAKPLAVLLVLTLLAAGAVYFVVEHGDALAPAAEPSSVVEPAPKREVDGLGAGAWTARLLAAPASKDWSGGAKALAALAELDPTALKNEGVAEAAAAVAVDAARSKQRATIAEEVFELLETRFGSEGLEVLYEVASSSRSGEGADRALERLAQPAVLRRAGPALRIAVELRRASCEQKHELFERAVSAGDERALAILTALRKRPCRRAKDPCCFAASRPLAKAITELKTRLKK